MAVLRRFGIRGYKSFRDVELRLRPIVVLVGPNASGKSNLFDALKLLAGFVNERTLEAAFEGHRGTPIESFHRAGRTSEEMQRERALRLSFDGDVELSAATVARVTDQVRASSERVASGSVINHRLLRYSVDVELAPTTGRLRVRGECLEALRRDAAPKASRKPFLGRDGTKLHLRREGGGHPYYHELGLDHTVLSEPLYPPHFAHAVAFREELARWRGHALTTADLRWGAAASRVEAVGRTGAGLASFLGRLGSEHPAELSRLTARLRELVPSVDGLQVEADSEGAMQLRMVEQGVPLSARVASSGTLRMLGILAAVSPLSGATLVTLEEPERSVHARRLSALVEVLTEAASEGGLQVVISTHSSAFASHFPDDAVLVCDKEGWETRFDPFGGSAGQLFREAAIEAVVDV